MVYVYVIGNARGPFKVGIAANVKRRVTSLQTGHHEQVLIHAMRQCADVEEARAIERLAHTKLLPNRLRGEWFVCSLEDAVAAIGADFTADDFDEVKPRSFDDIYEWLLQMLRLVPLHGREYLARLYGIDSPEPERLAGYRGTQIMAGNIILGSSNK